MADQGVSTSNESKERDSGEGFRALLVLFILLSFGLHVWRLDASSIWWDESLSLHRAQGSIGYILSNHIDFAGIETIDQHPPLYFLLLHGFVRLAGESDFVLRFPSATFATALVPILYIFGRRLRNARTGLWAALFGALSPFYLWYAHEARMYTMVTALGFLATYALWRALVDRRYRWGIAFFLLASAAVATQYLFALVLLGQGVLAFLLWPRDRTLSGDAISRSEAKSAWRRGWGLAAAGALLILLVCALGSELIHIIPWVGINRRYIPLRIILADALNSFSLGLSVSFRKVWFLDLLFLFVYLGGLVSAWERPAPLQKGHRLASVQAKRATVGLLSGYILIPALAIWLFSLFIPIYTNSRYLMASSPAFYLALGFALEDLGGRKRLLSWLVAGILVASMAYSLYQYTFRRRFQHREDYRTAARFVASNERPGDVVLVNGPENMTAFLHYYDGLLTVIGVPRGGATEEEIAARLQQIAGEYERAWLVKARTFLSDPEELVSDWIDDHALRSTTKVLPGYGAYLSVRAYLVQSPIEAVDAQAEPLAVFGDCLTMTDYSLSYFCERGGTVNLSWEQAQKGGGISSLPPVPAGHLLAAEFAWQPVCELGRYKTSLRLVHGGRIWAQRDRPPLMYLSSEDWPMGKRIGHETDLAVAPGTPPGAYEVRLRVYHADSGASLLCRKTGTGEGKPYLSLGTVHVEKGGVPHRVPLVPDGATRTPWGTTFGGRLALTGISCAPLEVRRGDETVLDLYWCAQRVMERNYSLVINVAGEDGQVWYTETHSPSGRSDYPTSRWWKDEMVWGRIRLSIPPDAPLGRHSVHLLIKPSDGEGFLWLRRGILPWAGRDVEVGSLDIIADERR